jgi:hypothetical protein
MPPNLTSNEIRLGIIGRTQRDSKVELCHFVDMNNHSHTIAVSKTSNDLSKYHMEIQKKTTDAVKALMDLSSLALWEDRAGVFQVATLEDAIKRVIYIYCNPSKAALCDTIDEYPGITSWSAFLECSPSIDAEVQIEARWYPVSEIPELPPNRSLNPKQDEALHKKLKDSKKALSHSLVLKPFKWLEAYGVTEPREIEKIRQKIITRVREEETAYALARAKSGKRASSPATVRSERFMKPHQPKKKERKIFLICSDKALRLRLLESFRWVIVQCKKCYRLARAGIRVDWPPGTFIPWFPPGFIFP